MINIFVISSYNAMFQKNKSKNRNKNKNKNKNILFLVDTGARVFN